MDVVLDGAIDAFYDAEYSNWFLDTASYSSIDEHQVGLIIGLIGCLFLYFVFIMFIIGVRDGGK
tara:strand:+ start:763 stop:954 length:192 start_codon:yes stop_codon:yes gene_type:complete